MAEQITKKRSVHTLLAPLKGKLLSKIMAVTRSSPKTNNSKTETIIPPIHKALGIEEIPVVSIKLSADFP